MKNLVDDRTIGVPPSTEQGSPHPGSMPEPIAIIGMSCRFPGAKDLGSFWSLLCNGVDAITEVPKERFDIDLLYDPRPAVRGKIVTRWGGYLDQIDLFDNTFFGIAPREAISADPQQRLLLEVAWEALEDAGEMPEALAGSRAGVFIGACYNDYEDLMIHNLPNVDLYVNTGGCRSIESGRLSYAFDLRGPSISIDTACSSSLIAVHLACQSLRSGECGLAMAGGVNLILHPGFSVGFSQANMLAPDGRCKTFDIRADGFVRSEGVGVVILKPLSNALADGNPIYALIRGSAANNDGRSSGLLMTPGEAGQEAVLREAYRVAGLAPEQVDYVEAHGTGTSVGDPVEARALGAVMGESRPAERPCRVGSVKSNIGHTEGAAGIAGLIKTTLALTHKLLPPSLHIQEPNPTIPWRELGLEVQRELTLWPTDREPARAGVSAFGISGTNAHIVLEEAPQPAPTPDQRCAATTAQLLPLSAHTPAALEARVRAYRSFVATETPAPAAFLNNVCYTAGARKAHHDYRATFVAGSQEALTTSLDAFLQSELLPGMTSGRVEADRRLPIVFIFPGQGSQWVGMGRGLVAQEPVFRAAVERCDETMRAFTDWSLIEHLTAEKELPRSNDIDVIQPMIFAIQVGLVALWRSWGVVPDAVVGHSMGEIAAAHTAGILSLEDAARVICCRSQLLRRVSGQGGMAVVGLSLEQTRRALAGYDDRLSIAVSNSPASTVVSGDTAALTELLATLQGQEVFCRPVKVDVASHSSQMDGLRADLLDVLAPLCPQPASIALYSTVTGTLGDGRLFDAAYWVRNLRDPVLFSTTLQRLAEDGHKVFVEISPHPILLGAVQQVLQHLGQEGTLLASLRHDEDERAVMLGSLGALYTLGHPIDWGALYPFGGDCLRLPAYPWQRERFWIKEPGAGTGHGWEYAAPHYGAGSSGHPLLGSYLRSAVHPETYFWEMNLNTATTAYLDDHRVQDMVVLPAAAYIELALAAAHELFPEEVCSLEQMTFNQMLLLPQDDSQAVQLVVTAQMPGKAIFQFFSRRAADTPRLVAWVLHASGTLRYGLPSVVAPDQALPEQICERSSEVVSNADHYQMMQRRGLHYGPHFQGVERIWRRDQEAIGRVRLAQSERPQSHRYLVHPALLDAGFQVLAAALSQDDGTAAQSTYVPVGLGRLRIFDRPPPDLWSYVLLKPAMDAQLDTREGDVLLLNEAGQVIVEALGLQLKPLDRRPQYTQGFDDWLYGLSWQSQARPPRSMQTAMRRGSWLIFAEAGSVGRQLAALLEAQGQSVSLVAPAATYRLVEPGYYQIDPISAEAYRQLLATVRQAVDLPLCGIVHLWSLTADPLATLDSLEAAQDLGCVSTTLLIQALVEAGLPESPHLWLVTRGAQLVAQAPHPVAVAQAPLWGLGRVIVNEHPELSCRRIDLDPTAGADELFDELWADDGEDEIALRGGVRYVQRLVRRSAEATPGESAATEPLKLRAAEDSAFRLELLSPGILDQMVLREVEREAPQPTEVEIEVVAVGLNFRDIMLALGVLPPPIELGWECAGTITAVGREVEGFQVGDAVLAFARNCIARFVVVRASAVIPKPAYLSFEEAATIPSAFMTAYYALHDLGRIRRGERVLIHAATGGVGLAAIQIAQWLGAEIYATAGSVEKRAFLASIGVSHIMDSRSLTFVDEVLEQTGGEGVDAILNSLAGDAIPAGFSILKPFGRFLELGKRDIYENTQLGMSLFHNNRSFFAIDLAHMHHQNPALFEEVLREVFQRFADGTFRPLPVRIFPIGEVADAFRYMAQARHIGKIVLSLRGQDALIARARNDPRIVRPDGTYLITGGLGGLGLSVAQWLVDRGARHLVLVGRSAATEAAEAAMERMRAVGAEVRGFRADIAQQAQVAGVLAAIESTLPPLRGVVHAAAILDDSILLHLDRQRFRSVMAPKMQGAWNLHSLTRDKALDFFVLFSSAASLIGNPGQGNYVAANAFLDALAQHRHVEGLPTLCINWGPWAEIGLAARPDRGGRLAMRGIASLTPEQGLAALERLLQADASQVGVMPVDWQQWRQFYPAIGGSSLFAHLLDEVAPRTANSVSGRIRDALLAAAPDEQRSLLEAFVCKQVARVVGLSSPRLDPQVPFTRLGLDSLMAVELKNWLEVELGARVMLVSALLNSTVAQLTTALLEQLFVAPSEPAPVQVGQALEDQPVVDIEHLSDADVDVLLMDLLVMEEGQE